MLRSLILWRLGRAEQQLGASIEYLRFILSTSLPAFFKFAKFVSLAGYRRSLPVDAHALGALVATREADCGGCVQIGVNLARQGGIPADRIRAVLDGRYDELPVALREVCQFALAVVRNTPEQSALRERVRLHYGDAGLVELSMAVAFAQVFPTTKRGLGFAESCQVDAIRI